MRKIVPVALLALGAAGLFAAPTTASARVEPSTVPVVVDAHVKVANKKTNYGTTTTLIVDGRTQTRTHALLKVKVPATATDGTFQLLLRPSTSSVRGVQVYRTGNGWQETGVTWEKLPSGRTLIGTSDALRAGVTEAISLDASQVAAGQELSLRIETTDRTKLVFASTEGAADTRPSLRHTPKPKPTPTATATPTPSVTPTPTPTPTPTTTPTTTPTPPTGTLFPPTGPFPVKIIGMSAPTSLWDQRLNEVGPNGVKARRVFADLTSTGTDQLPVIKRAIADGMMPVISYKVPDVDTLNSGGYDTWLVNLRTQLTNLNANVTVTFWHEPHGDMTPAQFRAGSLKFFTGVDAPRIAVGPILNGWLLDRRVSDFASYTDPNLLNKWEFVAIDSYQSGTQADPGNPPARGIPLLATWLDGQGFPDKPIGIGEYNGADAEAIRIAGETMLATPEVWFGLVWNNAESRFGILEGGELSAYQNTKADPRAQQ